MGDGIVARFDGPGRAVNCARRIKQQVAGLGIQIRSGAHTGEVELRGDDIGGIAVHIAARVLSKAGPGEILASRTCSSVAICSIGCSGATCRMMLLTSMPRFVAAGPWITNAPG